jgi:transposase
MQALHRVRGGWIRRKTALANQMRGLLLEHGVVMAKGDAALEYALAHLGPVPLPPRLRELVDELAGEWQGLSGRLATVDAELARLARTDRLARRLATTPGVGPITATAMVCKTLDPARFANARQFAAYFGLVPDQHSSGERVRLGHMSRRGDRYLRSLLINGAHAVLRTTRSDASDPDRKRLLRWLERHGRKGAAVRLANRNLRVIWALLQHQCDYHRGH